MVTNNQITTTTSTAPFFTLPLELRRIIYDLVQAVQAQNPRRVILAPTWNSRAVGCRPSSDMRGSLFALKATCRQIDIEADVTSFYMQNHFVAHDHEVLEAFIADTRPVHLRAIKSLEVRSLGPNNPLGPNVRPNSLRPQTMVLLKPFPGLKVLTLSDMRLNGCLTLGSNAEHPSRRLMIKLVEASRGMDSLQRIVVKTKAEYPIDISWYVYFSIDPDDIPNWVYSVRQRGSRKRVTETLQRVHGPFLVES